MSTNPSLALVIGLTDLRADGTRYRITDPRYKGPEDPRWWEEVPPLLNVIHKSFEEMNDTEIVEFLDATSVNLWLKEHAQEPIEFSSKIQWNPEYGVGSVIGLILSEVNLEEVLWALAAVYPEFQESGFRELPSVPLEEDESFDARFLRLMNELEGKDLSHVSPETKAAMAGAERKKRWIDHRHNYLYFTMQIDSWLAVAEHVLRWIGFDIRRTDLKLILYWEWS